VSVRPSRRARLAAALGQAAVAGALLTNLDLARSDPFDLRRVRVSLGTTPERLAATLAFPRAGGLAAVQVGWRAGSSAR
jgi:hypothetical protein